MSDATTTLLTSWEEKTTHTEDGAIITMISSGAPHTRAAFSAVRDRYNAVTGRPRPTLEDLQAMIGEKATLVLAGENMIGGEMIVAREGTIFNGSRGPAILPKRARRNGYGIDFSNLLDVVPGYATAKARSLIEEARAHFPTLRPLTQERLNELPEDLADDNLVGLCAFGTHRLPDSRQADALVLFGAYMREEDILDRGVVLVRPEHGVSEHGSMYGQHLLGGTYGEVVGYEPITFAEALALCELDFDEAYAKVVPCPS